MLPAPAQTILKSLSWKRRTLPKNNLYETLSDQHRYGNVRAIIRDRIATLQIRLRREI